VDHTVRKFGSVLIWILLFLNVVSVVVGMAGGTALRLRNELGAKMRPVIFSEDIFVPHLTIEALNPNFVLDIFKPYFCFAESIGGPPALSGKC
jgi:hypothetical protein